MIDLRYQATLIPTFRKEFSNGTVIWRAYISSNDGPLPFVNCQGNKKRVVERVIEIMYRMDDGALRNR